MDRQQVARGDHQRPRGERVRRDERHHEALHAPGQDGAAVGEVVARRARGRRQHEAVAAHRPRLLAVDRVGELGHALARATVDRDVVDRRLRALWRLQRERRERQHLEVAGQRALECAGQVAVLVGVDGGQEADLAVVDGEDRHARARVAAQGAQDGAVAAQRHTQLDVVAERGVEDEAVAGREPVLARLLGVEAQQHALALGGLDEGAQGLGGLCRAGMGEHGGGAGARGHGSTSRARASRSDRARRAPASASHTNVSRLPFGPGRPDEAKPSTAAP